jgi:propionyl-CoA carboxylase alpha chain
MAVKLNGNGDAEPLQITLTADGYAVEIDGKTVAVRTDWRPGDLLMRAQVDGRPVTVQVDRDGIAWRLTHRGATVTALVLSPRVAELARLMPLKRPPDSSKFLLSPMPGLLKSIAVAEGQEVKAGEELAVVEAMKMENILRALRDGRVAKRHAAPGDSLAVDQKILEFG